MTPVLILPILVKGMADGRGEGEGEGERTEEMIRGKDERQAQVGLSSIDLRQRAKK